MIAYIAPTYKNAATFVLLQPKNRVDNVAFEPLPIDWEREYCVQYRETDFAFIERLAAEEGWYYYFSHHEKSHELHFAHQSTSSPILGTLTYNANPAGDRPFASLWRFSNTSVIDNDALKVGIKINLTEMAAHYALQNDEHPETYYIQWIQRGNSKLPDYIQDFIPVGERIDNGKTTSSLLKSIKNYTALTFEDPKIRHKVETDVVTLMRNKFESGETVHIEEDKLFEKKLPRQLNDQLWKLNSEAITKQISSQRRLSCLLWFTILACMAVLIFNILFIWGWVIVVCNPS